jgi:diguanylate cyclase (GGDEF)-like protein
VTEKLMERIRNSVRPLLPPTFASTEIVVLAEESALPAGTGESVTHELYSLLQLENRTAGVLLLYSSKPFAEGASELLGIYSTQVSMLLGSIRTREKISNLADTDELTGIWNRRYFRRQLPREIERARVYNIPLALLIIDVDDFKGINDNFGHTVGDVVLSELAGAVRETLRPPDTFTRFGGDEFSIILPHTDLAGARAVAERILSRVHDLSIDADEQLIRCTISIGIAELQPALDTSANHLVRRADERLYEAKHAGKNRYNA